MKNSSRATHERPPAPHSRCFPVSIPSLINYAQDNGPAPAAASAFKQHVARAVVFMSITNGKTLFTETDRPIHTLNVGQFFVRNVFYSFHLKHSKTANLCQDSWSPYNCPDPKVVKIPFENSCIWIVIHISTEIEPFLAGEIFHPSKNFVSIRWQLLELSAKFITPPSSCSGKNCF